ncbi:hypothetical protein GCM10010519_56780 [Streptomyces lactacystinicus]
MTPPLPTGRPSVGASGPGGKSRARQGPWDVPGAAPPRAGRRAARPPVPSRTDRRPGDGGIDAAVRTRGAVDAVAGVRVGGGGQGGDVSAERAASLRGRSRKAPG